MKPKLYIHVKDATHFLGWELPYFHKEFELVEVPGDDVVLFAFGPDVLESAIELPALRRVALLFPGFGRNPYYDIPYREEALRIFEDHYDLIFVNPGPLEEAYKSSKKVNTCPFSICTSLFPVAALRRQIDSLLHVSVDTPQKDWKRSEAVMRLTGLRYELFPPRDQKAPFIDRVKRRLNRYSKRIGFNIPFNVMPYGYADHKIVVNKYQEYDGFVHIAARTPDTDGKYTAALLEAGASGAILFWHDTLNLGNHLETVFELPVEPTKAAQQILEIRNDLNVEQHSRRTREEIIDKFDPQKSVGLRAARIKELL